MSTNQITIKHNKHRIHPCPNEQKLALLNMLLSQNSGLSIVIALSDNSLLTKEAITEPNVTVLSDEELAGLPELKCELLISYDLPQSAEIYISRLSKTTDSAIAMLDISEQNSLYPIETLLGRVIRQEVVTGFEYPEQPKMKIAPKPSLKPKSDAKKVQRKPFDKPKRDKKPFEKSDRPKREDEKSEHRSFEKPKYGKPKKDGEKSKSKSFDKPKYDKPKKEGEKPKYDKKPNKFLGKDENGKAKFSGKSGERNHRYDGKPKESTEAPKKEGRKISIKALKPKENSEPNS
ncbi:MAG: hypothetical protein PHX44_02970 [Sulfurimonas sp.]|uniref:hypothetical protein n=1 Tax=Sulfurimonas sp. TaxID=2022749 RepID=UPI00261C5360|nr:hypothetical protein [Sulfurimonas sp.]MDD2652000.1 hypothetical protein [Sulfurimonas sp.]MDD3451874.1 hypothetical protein [Sulfurimonas sp.]